MYQSVLVATDGSDLATAAVKHAASIAHAFNSRLTIVSVALLGPVIGGFAGGRTISPTVFEELRRVRIDHCSAILKEAAEVAGPAAQTEMVEFLTAYEGILDIAKKVGADLIVMGSHSRNPISRLILGSQTSKVVNLSEVPGLVFK